jgi:hypothetical protein
MAEPKASNTPEAKSLEWLSLNPAVSNHLFSFDALSKLSVSRQPQTGRMIEAIVQPKVQSLIHPDSGADANQQFISTPGTAFKHLFVE